MLYTTIKRRGKDFDCEVHVIDNGIIEVRNYFRSISTDNYVRYTPIVPMTVEQILEFLIQLVVSTKETSSILNDYRFRIEKYY